MSVAENKEDCLQDTTGFERAMARLEGIVAQLEDGEVGLAEALQAYEEGVKHLRHCYQLLERAERRIELLAGVDAEGHPVCRPFEEEDAPLEKKAAARSRRRSSGNGPAPAAPDEGSAVDDRGRLF